ARERYCECSGRQRRTLQYRPSRYRCLLHSSSTATMSRINHLAFELDVLPRVGVAGTDEAGEHILPLSRLYSRPDPVHESVAEHRDEVVVLEDFALDLFSQRLARGRIIGCQISVIFGVEFWDTEFVGSEHAVAFDFGLVPIRPSSPD